MTKPAPAHAAETNAGLLKREPAMIAALAAWLTGNIGLLLVSHFHYLTGVQWSAMSLYVTAMITFVLAGVAGWLLRRIVAPAWKLAEAEAARLGITLPDLGYIPDQPTSSIYQAGVPPAGTLDDSLAAGHALATQILTAVSAAPDPDETASAPPDAAAAVASAATP